MAVGTIVWVVGASTTDYEAAKGEMGWPDEVPAALILQAVGSVNGDLRVVGIWKSRADFNTFVNDWLYPALADVGVGMSEEPRVEEFELYELWPEKGPGA